METGTWLGFGLLACILTLAAVTDCRTGRIPNRLTIPAMLAGIVIWTWSGAADAGMPGAVTVAGQCLLALAIGFIPCALLVMLGGMGGGDAKLIGAMGALSADWRFVVGAVFYGFVAGACIAVALMIRHRLVRRTAARISMALLTLVGRRRPAMGDDSPRVPMGAALFVGAGVAGLERFGLLSWAWTP